MDELLAKGAIEPSTGGAGFCSNVFVTPEHTYSTLTDVASTQQLCFFY